MWEPFGLEVVDEEGNVDISSGFKLTINMENKSEEERKENGGAKSSGVGLRVRSPLAPVSTNHPFQDKGVSSSNNVNNNDDELDNTLLAASEDFFTYRRDPRPIFIPTVDHFARLSDEMILHIFKWLPKKTLTRCCFVSARFNKIVHTDILWTRLDLGGKNLKRGALGNIISRGVVILRLASAEIHDPIFDEEISDVNWDEYNSKLQYLDLSMCTISTHSLELLLSKCRKLKKLSLEHVKITDEICEEIAENPHLDSLNLTMCEGMTVAGVETMTLHLKKLRCLNISWTSLTAQALEIFVHNVTPDLLRLNIAGCRQTMTDRLLAVLICRCPGLVELDISDCPKLTTDGLKILSQLKALEYLSISRCYSVDVPAFL